MFLTIISFAFVITVLVFVHELGHYLAARSTGMKVEKFSVGFPPRFLAFTSMPGGWNFKIFFYKINNRKFIWAPIFESFIKVKNKKGSGTEYCLALLPIGGYVKIVGILDESMDSTSTGADYEYQSKKTWQKLWFTSAGVIFNFILSFLIFTILFSYSGTQKNKINFIINKLYPEKIEDIQINGNQLNKDEKVFFNIGYTSKIDTSVSNDYNWVIDETKGQLQFSNLIAKKIHKIDVSLPFKIKEILDIEEDIEIILNLDSSSLTIKPINNGNILSKRGYTYIATIEHDSLEVKNSPIISKLLTGDRIVKINGQSVNYYKDIVPLIEQVNNIKPLDITVLRGKETKSFYNIEPIIHERYNQYGNKESFGKLGFSTSVEDVSILESLSLSFESVIKGIVGIFSGIFELITGQVSSDGIGGPITIAKMTGEQASSGFLNLLYFMALISINLGVINILPFPGLDGGHALIAIIEKLKGSKISSKTLIKIQQFGMFILLSFFVWILLKDLNFI